jgi:hypothetical protein
MRILLVTLFITLAAMPNGQAQTKLIRISPQFGFRMHDDTYSAAKHGGGRRVLASPTAGIFIHFGKSPVSLGWQTDINGQMSVPTLDSTDYAIWFLNETWISHQVELRYSFEKIYLGLGAYWQRREGYINHLIPIPGVIEWKTSGLHLSAGLPFSSIDIEYRTRIKLQPDFATIISSSQHSLLLLYNLGKRRNPGSVNKTLAINGLTGARFFPTGNIELLTGEDFTPIGIAPLVGIELLHKKSGISLNLERDWWLALNGGSFRRDVKGYINSAFIGLGYHKLLQNDRHIRFRVGGSFIIDYDKLVDISLSTPNKDKLGNYQVKGIGAMVSYELLPDTDIEIKHTFPWLGDKLFNPTRFSLGLIYRYNPD